MWGMIGIICGFSLAILTLKSCVFASLGVFLAGKWQLIRCIISVDQRVK